MKLEDLKQHKDKYCTKYTIEKINLIKKYFKIKSNKRVFAFYIWCRREYFLCDNKVYIVCFDWKNNNIAFESLYVATLKNGNVINFETIIPDDTTPKTKIYWDCIEVDCKNKLYTKEEFLTWLNSPCTTTEMVDVTYKQAIKFLQNYKKDTFKTDNYLFYIKRDKDYTWADNFYAYDIKNQAEMKLYFNSYIDTFLPVKSKDIFVEDLSGKLSEFQLRKCKKEFMTFMKEICPELNIENFYALEFVKQCIQPIEKDRGWGVRKPFIGNFEFQNIWIDDFKIYDMKPYFVITEGNNEWLSTKACAIDFLKPEYKSKEPYINGYYKRNHWELDDRTIKRLVEFLKAPFDYKKDIGYLIAKKKQSAEKLKKIQDNWKNSEIKTNWQWLISEYNANLSDGDEELPLDLAMPDYTLLNKKEV